MQTTAMFREGDRLSLLAFRGGKQIRYRIKIISTEAEEGLNRVIYGPVGGSLKHIAYFCGTDEGYMMYSYRNGRQRIICTRGEIV